MARVPPMLLPGPLISGRLLRRYKRFLADVELDNGEIITAHCANPGAMTGLKEPGIKVWLSRSDNPKRKLKFSWELVEFPDQSSNIFAGINTAHPNRIVREAIEGGKIKELAGYASLRTEVRYGQNSRIDILLEDENRPPCYVEVKNVHLLRRPGLAEFPDSVTARGAKHLVELSDMVHDGARAVMLYLIQRTDAEQFALAADIDPKYAQCFQEASGAGVEAYAYDCQISPEHVTLNRYIPFAE